MTVDPPSVETDAIRGPPGWSRRKPVLSPERYYYTANRLFEQSLDVYRPAASASKKTPPSSSSPAVVALVVGSAWLGHRSFVYSGTSWWNSSGPKTVANLGYICVCIRHRGSFMKSLSILTMAFVAIMVAIVAAFTNAIVDDSVWVPLEEIVGEKISFGLAGGYMLAFLTGLVLIELGGIGSANFDDMQSDVMDALSWLNDNEERLHLVDASSTHGCGSNADAKSKQRCFIFGGYSSGGHVAATVTQQPHLWKSRNLPPPHIHCDSILYISPVLSTKSHHKMLLEKISSLSSSSSLPSLTPSTSDETSSSGQLSPQSSMTEASVSSSISPTWLTDRVVKAVFGVGSNTPSPIHTYEKSPLIPHIFLGCRKEMFGLNWLDTFFCSASYCDLLNSIGVDSHYTAVKSDHWNILSSTELSNALRSELEWIELKCNKEK